MKLLLGIILICVQLLSPVFTSQANALQYPTSYPESLSDIQSMNSDKANLLAWEQIDGSTYCFGFNPVASVPLPVALGVRLYDYVESNKADIFVRDLTTDEITLCTQAATNFNAAWFVARNGKYLTRPVYDATQFPDVKKKIGVVTILDAQGVFVSNPCGSFKASYYKDRGKSSRSHRQGVKADNGKVGVALCKK